MKIKFTLAVALAAAASIGSAQKAAHDGTQYSVPLAQLKPSKPLRPISVANASVRAGVAAPAPTAPIAGGAVAVGAAVTAAKPLKMRMLIIAADGDEPAFDAIRNTLEHIGVPYDAIVAKTQPLPVLNDATTGFYQGIILTSGNLAVEDANGNWSSALSAASWTALDNYARDYKVRTLAMYAFPEARYGLTFISALSPTDQAPAMATIPAAGKPVFSYVNTANQIKIQWAYTYLAAPTPAAGETTTPIVTINGQTAGALHTKADGREYLALTFDNSPYLTHSLLLNYGLVNWVARGVFLGSRQAYLTPQNDDLFLPNDLFVNNQPACQPLPGSDPTYDPAVNCPSLRINGADLDRLASWQDSVRRKTQTANFQLTHAFNGFGATTAGGATTNDSLKLRAIAHRNRFYWVSHTYDHEHLDCFNPVPNSGICRGATYNESRSEITQNISVATSLLMPLDRTSMVTPAISGLNNPNFMRAAGDSGIRYLVGDMSRPEHVPAIANTGIRSTVDTRILIIPRRATNIFYNTTTPNVGANGSETDEYNFLYGPSGIFRLSNGAPFFDTAQTYAQVIDRESDALVTYMLRGELYPSMFHQSNFDSYNGGHSLFTDLMDATFAKFAKMTNLPISSLAQTTIGSMLVDRSNYLAAGVAATYTPGVGITVQAQKSAYVPFTGVCSTGCVTYGGQKQSRVLVSAGRTVTLAVAP
ncbi:MAG: hypothetical protein R2762_24590 [Bryobacteraceae bacterium]